tara:strand:- start:213 stop:479 length:267 start_codon:yes stop_codon:yes gene_type:complete
MAASFLDYILRDLEWEMRRKIRNYIIGMAPEPVRKIVGLILLIIGVVALLRFYPVGLFYDLSELMSFLTLSVGIFSIILGRMFLRHKG